MSRGPPTFRQRDVAAAVKAVKAAGCDVVRVEVDKAGKIVVVTAKGAVVAPEGVVGKNEWDDAE
jgi:hypothetical protein